MCEVVRTLQCGKAVFHCKKTGLPITTNDESGAWCDKMCGFHREVFVRGRVDQWMEDMGPVFEQLKDKE